MKKSNTNEIQSIAQLPVGFYRKSVAVGNLVYALEERGIVFVSSDAGVTWKEFSKISGSVVCNDFSVSGDIIFVASTNGDVYKLDKNQWTTVKVKDSLNLTTIRFIDNDNGFVCGSFGKIYYTTNSGSTWQESTTPSYAMITDVYMTSTKEAFACGFDGELYKTSNKGASWTKFNTASLNENVVTIAMHDNMRWGVAATSNGNLIYTDDAFKTWKTIYNFGGLITDIIIQGTEFIAVGQYSLLLKGAFLPTSVEETIEKTTIRVYPNPSSGEFTFIIPNNEQLELSLSVFDNLGKKVQDLLTNEQIPIGEFKYNFDASRLMTGVYRLNVKQANSEMNLPIIVIR
ncbi:MAG: T9SS type A sorting domain-containing protein [Ignavibacteria bacterium]|nr:T9SS type A sorting domain-containing protein [Ignavibacteria bacterium]